MQELAARINAVALKVEEKLPAQLPDRPQRVADPLANLLQQSFVLLEAAPAAAAQPIDTNSAPLPEEEAAPTEGPQAPAHAPSTPAPDAATTALPSQ